jgi:subtilisin family serine protease
VNKTASTKIKYVSRLFIFSIISVTVSVFVFPLPIFQSKAKVRSKTNRNVQLTKNTALARDLKEETYIVKVKDKTKKKRVLESLSITPKELLRPQKRSGQPSDKWVKVKLENYEVVLSIEKNGKRKVATLIPNDPAFNDYQWNFINTSLASQSASAGWDTTTGSANTVIAVIDTGVDIMHPDLQANIWINTGESGPTASEGPVPNCTSRGLTLDKKCNNIDDDGNGIIDDVNGFNFADSWDGSIPSDGKYDDPVNDNINTNVYDTDGHGTHVAGVIAAVTNNNRGVAGTCWTCKIMPLRVINSQGYGYDSDIANAIEYAVDNGAHVINMSLGGEGYSQILQDAVDYAWQNNVFVVSASGNAGGSASDSYPSGLDHTLSVGATDMSDAVPGFSNSGKKLDLTAPGDSILSTYKCSNESAGCGTNGIYASMTGTSMASPHVAGVAALIRDLNPSWTVKDFRNALVKHIDDLGTSGFDDSYGYGRLNAKLALESPQLAVDSVYPVATLDIPNPTTISGNLSLTGTASDDNLYIYTISIARSIDNFIIKQLSGRSSVSNNTLAVMDTRMLYNGSYNISFKAEDFYGNITASNTINITIDNPPPLLSLVAPANNSWSNTGLPYFDWNQSSYPSGSPRYDIYVNGSLYAANIGPTSYTPSTALAEGNYSWYVVEKEFTNSTYTKLSNTLNFRVDKTLPNNFDIGISNNNNSVTFTYDTSDNLSGIDRYEISINNGTFTQAVSPYNMTLSDGDHNVTVKAFDKANNNRSVSKNFKIQSRLAFLKSKGDVTGDGKVNLSDLSLIAENWLKYTSNGDTNGDGKVDLTDLSILAQYWNQSF